MVAFARLGGDTSYSLLLPAMFVMGVGMGAAMMPIMSAALQTLKKHQVARGSTLLNIVEQVGSAIGVAILSTILTNRIQSHPLVGPAILMQTDPKQAAAAHVTLPADQLHLGLSQGAGAYALTFTVALALVALCLIPAWLLPRRKPAAADQPQPVPVG